MEEHDLTKRLIFFKRKKRHATWKHIEENVTYIRILEVNYNPPESNLSSATTSNDNMSSSGVALSKHSLKKRRASAKKKTCESNCKTSKDVQAKEK